jgi:hypothetical protein
VPLFGSVAVIREKALKSVPSKGGSVPGPWGGVDGPRRISGAGVVGLTGRRCFRGAMFRSEVLLFRKQCGGKNMVEEYGIRSLVMVGE